MKPFMMKIREWNREQFFICPNIKHKEEKMEDTPIPIFYSALHAQKNSWIFTDNLKWSIDGSVVAICPECAKSFLKNET